ncbi:MAG: hypothetical protein H6Q55_3710 [Deltaproteobacteria bacterium]|nr:hypothetical protein [Deltaproteobacteria bacterium]
MARLYEYQGKQILKEAKVSLPRALPKRRQWQRACWEPK